MQWSGPHIGAYEKIWASFFLGRNEWYEVDWNSVGSRHNMRGHGVYFVLKQEIIDSLVTLNSTGLPASGLGKVKGFRPSLDGNVFGLAVHCLSVSYTNVQHTVAVGIIDDELISGDEVAMGVWVTVQVYGYHDWLAFNIGEDANAGVLAVSSATGLCTKGGIDAMAKPLGLRGVALFSGAPPYTLDLSGAAGTGTTWPAGVGSVSGAGVAVNKDTGAISSDTKPPLDGTVVGYKFAGAGIVDAISPSTIKRFKGWISNMGTTVGRI